jgi:hypothetical protein
LARYFFLQKFEETALSDPYEQAQKGAEFFKADTNSKKAIIKKIRLQILF